MAYPVRYRPARYRAPSRSGSQGSGGVPQAGFGPRLAPPTPANTENYFDDVSAALDRAQIAPARILPRFLGRAIPILGGALLAYELFRWYNDRTNLQQLGKFEFYADPAWWVLDQACSPMVNFRTYTNGWPVCGTWPVGRNANQTVPTNPLHFYLWFDTGEAYLPGHPSNKMNAGLHYKRVDLGAAQLPPYAFPYAGYPALPSIAPFPMPQLNPWQNPIQGPVPEFAPMGIPVSALPNVNPLPDIPTEVQWQTGPRARPRYEQFSPWEATLSPRTTTRVTPRPNFPPRARPRKGEKDRKFIVSPGANNVIRRVFDYTSEYEDFIDALYWAVPGKKIPPKFWKDPLGNWHRQDAGIIEKSEFVYKNLDNIDMEKAIKNVARNQLTDAFWGRIGKAQAKGARNVHDTGTGSPSRTYTISRRFGTFQ